MKAVIYARTSTTLQSIDSQVEACKDLISQQDGTLVHIFSDVGFSGTDLNRPSLLDMIKQSSDGEFDTVVTFEYSRLFKNTKELGEFISVLGQQNIELLAVKNQSSDQLIVSLVNYLED